MKTSLVLLLSAVIAASWGLRIERQAPEEGETNGGIDIYNLFVTSEIRHRFATTLVTSRVANREAEAREVTFYMQLPNEAFISNFTMEIGGEIRVGEVQEKEQAERRYQAARARGETAGQAKAVARAANSFKVAVNLAANDLVTFNLTYQELLPRRLGLYEHVININPGQIVHDMRIRVNIEETAELTRLMVPQLRQNFQGSSLQQEQDNDLAIIYQPNSHSAEITFEPTVEEQRNMSWDGVVGQFAVQYDVKRNPDAGEIELVNGYFVHYFAPSGLEPIPKDILFVLDISGSMSGRKIAQVRASMAIILGELRDGDRFNVFLFSDGVQEWRQSFQPVNEGTVQNAQTFVDNTFGGGTQILNALKQSLRFMNSNRNSDNVPIIMFLTDGQGSQTPETVLREIGKANEAKIPIFSLAYGTGANWDFLKQLSLQNSALARKIYEESDAALQLQGFYREVASPILRNVTFNYVGDSIDTNSLTSTGFDTFYGGNELVVAGQINLNALAGSDVGIQVVGASSAGPVTYMASINCSPGTMIMDERCPVTGPPITLAPATSAHSNGDSGALADFTERLWAYLTIKEVLKKRTSATSPMEKEQYKQKALELSLKYNFVTQVTSMIVVQDDEAEAKRSELEEEDASANRPLSLTRPHTTNRPSRGGGGGGGRGGGSGFVDSDPHILTVIGGVPVCFNLYGTDDQTYLLFKDRKNDIEIYGTLKTSLANPNGTFFNTITVESRGRQVIFTLDSMDPLYPIMNGPSPAARHQPFLLSRVNQRNMDIIFKQGLTASIHLGRHGHNEIQENFLGLYFNSKPIYTEVCRPTRFGGVIGQFMCDSAEVLPVMAPPRELEQLFKSLTNIARLRVWDASGVKREAFAAAGFRHNLHKHIDESCWFVHDQGDQIMKHSVASYELKTAINKI